MPELFRFRPLIGYNERARMACLNAGAAQSKRPPLAIGALHLDLEQIETAHATGRSDIGTHLVAIERRIIAAERKLWRAPKHAASNPTA